MSIEALKAGNSLWVAVQDILEEPPTVLGSGNRACCFYCGAGSGKQHGTHCNLLELERVAEEFAPFHQEALRQYAAERAAKG